MQLTLATLLTVLALSPLSLAADSSKSGSSSVKPTSSDSKSSSSSSSGGGPTATPAYTLSLNPAQSSAFASYTSSRGHESSLRSSLDALTASATQTSALSAFDPYGTSAMSVLQKAVTATPSASLEYPSIPSGLPKQYSSYWSSVYKAEASIIAKHATNSSNAAVGMPTAAVMAAGAGLLGAVGLAGMM